MDIKWEIGFNKQDDNYSWNNIFKGNTQCFGTSVYVLMSYYNPALKAEDDIMLAKYIDDIEVSVGQVGIGEEIQKEHPEIKGHTSYYWEVQRIGMQSWMKKYNIDGVACSEYGVKYNRIKEILTQGPVVIGTNKMGSLPGGHIILSNGCTETGLRIKDPFGNALTGYQDKNGDNLIYSDSFLSKYFTGKLLYWRGV